MAILPNWCDPGARFEAAGGYQECNGIRGAKKFNRDVTQSDL